VNGARDAVLDLDVNLGQVELSLGESRLLLDVSLGGAVNHVAHLKAFHSLVLGADLCAVKATNDVGVATVLLVPSVISSFSWHIFINNIQKQLVPFTIFFTCTPSIS